MTRGERGPRTGTYETYNGMIGERNMSIADFPAVPLSQVSQEVFSIVIQCLPTSTVGVWIGGADNQWILLSPGDTFTLPFNNPNLVYAEGNNGIATICWLAVT